MSIRAHESDFVHVYLASISSVELKPVCSIERREEIELTKNEKLKREKQCVWSLLEYALTESFGKNISELEFIKHKSGRWSTPFCEFSLSHTDGFVAVALSSTLAVGVDVEVVKPRGNDKTAERIMRAEEYEKYRKLPNEEREEFFFSVWTSKEAIFKSLHLDAFSPSYDYSNAKISVNTKSYITKEAKVIVSVASQCKNVKFFDSLLK